MPTPTLFIGPDTLSVRSAAIGLLGADCTDCLVFIPSNLVARTWKRLFRGEAGGWVPHFANLNTWLPEAASLCAQSPLYWVKSDERQFLLRGLLPRLGERLPMLRGLAGSAEWVRQLDKLMGELRLSGLDNVPGGGDWSDELDRIDSAYLDSLREKNGWDIESAGFVFAENIEHWSRRPRSVVFDGLLAVPPAHWAAIGSLLPRVETACATFAIPALPEGVIDWDSLESYARDMALGPVLAAWRSLGAKLLFCPNAATPSRARAVRALHDRGVDTNELPPDFLTLTEAHTPREEMARIAAHIRASVANGADIERVRVVLAKPKLYAGIIEPAFQAHGVQLGKDCGRRRDSLPVVRRLLRLLELHRSRWPVDAIADIFGDRLFAMQDSGGRSLDARRLRQYCLAKRHNCVADLEISRSQLQDADADSPASEEIEGYLDCIGLLHETVPHGEFLALDWLAALRGVVKSTAGYLREEKHEAAREASLQVEILLRAAKQVADRSRRWFDDKPRDAGEYLDWLKLELESDTSPLPGARRGVEIIDPYALHADAGGILYFAGLSEGDFPPPADPNALFARHRDAFAPWRAYLPDSFQEASYKLAVCLNEADALHLSYPRSRGGREALRSPLLEDLTLRWPGKWPELPAPSDGGTPTSRAGLLNRLAKASFPLPKDIDELCRQVGTDAGQLQTIETMERERQAIDQLGAYLGNLDGDREARQSGAELVTRFLAASGASRTLDSTRLRHYAQCPMKFWFRYMLKLDAPQDFADDLQANESGTLIHEIVERFYRDLEIDLVEERIEPLWMYLEAIVRAEVEKRNLHTMIAEAEIRRLIGPRGRRGGLLNKFLITEIEQHSGTTTKPAFAMPTLPVAITADSENHNNQGLESRFQLQVYDIEIAGKIDRIDASSGGELAVVIDYKTEFGGGRKSGFERIDAGLEFQLALYLLEARRRFTTGKHQSPRLAAAFFAIRDGEYVAAIGNEGALGCRDIKTGRGKPFSPQARELGDADFERWLAMIADRVAEIGRLIDRGRFHVSLNTPEDAGCRYCAYRMACRQSSVLQAPRHEAHAGRGDVYLPLPMFVKKRESD